MRALFSLLLCLSSLPALAEPYRRASVSGERLELTLRWRGDALDLYLADPDTNAPIADAAIDLRWSDGARAAGERAHDDGAYRAQRTAGVVGLTASVVAEGRSDLFTFEALRFGEEPVVAAPKPHEQPWLWIGLAFAGLVVAGFAGFLTGRRRAAAGVVLAVVVSGRVAAHGGEDHGAPVVARTGDERLVPKEIQFLLGVRTTPAVERSLVERLRVPGTVVAPPDAQATLRAPRAGRVQGPLATRGAHVHAGEVLATIVELTANAERARARGESEQAQARLVALRAELRRKDSLSDVTSLQERERLRADIRALEAEGRASQAAAEALDETRRIDVVAPFDGVVVEVGALTPDTFVAENESLFTIVRPERFEVAAHVFEREAPVVGDGDARVLGVTTYTAPRLGSTPVVDAATRAVDIRYAGTAGLMRDQYVEVDVPIGPPATLVTVPAAALDSVEGRPVVVVKTAPESFATRPVVVVRRDGDDVGVRGLEVGERVVIVGLGYVR